ncbi:MAG: hypothetical protein IT374_10735 [Polyangiaceae bacterium]|nr:hypothetical protein [Polyangiaceae bacterium]
MARKQRSGVEWVGGLVTMPAYVTGEGAPHRPEALFWMSAEGAVLGQSLARPGEAIQQACDSLRSAIERPMFGRPHAPDRVRVATPELAEALRTGHPGLQVICAPTPEIDALLAAMRGRLADTAHSGRSYLSPGVGVAATAAFFRAHAALFRAEPWNTVPSDQSLFAVSIEELGVADAALSVVGQLGECRGWLLFSGIDDFEDYVEAIDAMGHGEAAPVPPHLVLAFERRDDQGAALQKEIAAHRWEVAGADAYPWLAALDEDLVGAPPTAEEITIAEAIALALPRVLEEKEALLAAWNGGAPVRRTVVVATHTGDLEVSIGAPCEREPRERRPPDEVLAELLELGRDGDEIDPMARRSLEDEILRGFVASPEAGALGDVQSCHLVMDLAAIHFGATIATLGPRELSDVVFEILPGKVGFDASEARPVIAEIRAFYAFLGREFALEQASACLRVLDGDAVERLEAALSDPSKFGVAKSFFVSGREAGFDMASEEGFEAWVRAVRSRALPASAHPAPPRAPTRAADKAAARAAKNARKAKRKARKKNR